MSGPTRLILAGLIVVASAAPLPMWAQDSTLVDLLTQSRFAVSLSGDTLGGPGGRLLLDEGRAARYALVGEEHGIAEIPAFAAAWFRGLVPAGYRRLAVEVGPDAGALLDSLAALGLEALRDFQAAHPPGFPFFIKEPESRMAVAARRALPEEPEVLLGIDYDIVGDRYLFDALEAAAPDGAARAAVREVRADADARLVEVVRTGDPGRMFLFSASEEPFERLRRAVAAPPGSRADRIIETMRETAAINRLFLNGANWESNHRRSSWIKRSMARHLSEARAEKGGEPRVMVKMGSNHLYRGLNRTRQYDVGTMLAQVAEADGASSFHLLVIGGPGSERSVFDPVEIRYVTRPAAALDELPPGLPLGALAFAEGWTLFDLRPLRPAIHDRRLAADDALTDLVFHFDAVLLIARGAAAKPLFDPGAALRRPP